MKPWRLAVLDLARSPSSNLVLAVDPDRLLRDEQILATLASQGVEVVTFDDPIAFRYHYESRFRGRELVAGETPPVLLVRSDRPDLRHLPYDVLQAGQPLTVSLHLLCPQLSYPVLRDVFHTVPDLFDRLLVACRALTGPPLSEQRSLAFIARTIYDLDPTAITGLDDLVPHLLHIHHQGWPLPPRVQHWLVQALDERPALHGYPLAAWLADRDPFLIFVAAQWRSFLYRRGLPLAAGEVRDASAPLIDFDHPATRALVDTLFLENKLPPITIIAERPPADWTAVGVIVDTAAHTAQRLAQRLDEIARAVPEPAASPGAWLDLAPVWAEVLVLSTAALPPNLHTRLASVRQRLDTAFVTWLQTKYDALHSLPFLPQPVVGHQIAHFLAQRWRQGVPRLALVVLDGLALDQWQVLQATWQTQGAGWTCEERALFAVLPTITPLARQAIFAGVLPFAFADTWTRTDADGRRWQQFWQAQGLTPGAVGWVLGADRLSLALSDRRIHVLGLVINDVDDMVHSTLHGGGELHDRIRHWAAHGTPGRAVAALLAAGFDIWLTSDHGNAAAEGIGRPHEGVLVAQPGSRVRFYDDPAFLVRAQVAFHDTLAWTPGGLPAGLQTLFAAGRAAFANHGEKLLTHGGLTLEEVIVPWIHVTAGEDAA